MVSVVPVVGRLPRSRETRILVSRRVGNRESGWGEGPEPRQQFIDTGDAAGEGKLFPEHRDFLLLCNRRRMFQEQTHQVCPVARDNRRHRVPVDVDG